MNNNASPNIQEVFKFPQLLISVFTVSVLKQDLYLVFRSLNYHIILRSEEFFIFWVLLITSLWCHLTYSLGYRLFFY